MAIHVDEYGIDFIITVKEDTVVVDISAAQMQIIRFTRPDGTAVSRPSTFVNTGSDGKIHVVSDQALFNSTGTWKYHAEITTATGFFKTVPTEFTVTDLP